MPEPIVEGQEFPVYKIARDCTVVRLLDCDHIEAGQDRLLRPGRLPQAWALLVLHHPDHGYVAGWLGGERTVEGAFLTDSVSVCVHGGTAPTHDAALAALLPKFTRQLEWHSRRLASVVDAMRHRPGSRAPYDSPEVTSVPPSLRRLEMD